MSTNLHLSSLHMFLAGGILLQHIEMTVLLSLPKTIYLADHLRYFFKMPVFILRYSLYLWKLPRMFL